jgi:hypothetical protein
MVPRTINLKTLQMKNFKILLFTFLIAPLFCFSQEQAKDSIVDKPERDAFESSTLVDNQTNVVFQKNTLEVMMQHRFDYLDRENSLLGIYGSANIRIGATYSILDWLTVGYGITKEYVQSDFSVKAAILRQTRSGRTPVSITYYGNMAINGKTKKLDYSVDPADNNPPPAANPEAGIFLTKQDRYSYFHQLIIAKRFDSKLSLQIAPSLTHFNAVNYGYENDRFSIAFGGRYKISAQTSIIFDYTQPITQLDNPDSDNSLNHPGFSLGAEFSTSGHAFQIFIANYKGILPQYNTMKNDNNFFDGTSGMLIGFNITRRYNF